jgi:hypothetical protein
MNAHNLFDYCSNEITSLHKTIYFIGNMQGNSVFTIAIDNTDNKIYSYSNEWLHLINFYYNSTEPSGLYAELVTYCNNIIQTKCIDFSYADCDVIPLITSFSKGTIHGYSGLFYILNEYINNLDTYKNYKIIVYKDSQQGLLDIINHFINKNVINKEDVMYLSSNVQYLFNSIKFIPNKWHMYPQDLTDNFDFLLDNYLVRQNYPIVLENDNICIIKSSLSDNKTLSGIINAEKIKTFCNKNKLLSLEPTQMNEIKLINKINQSRIFVVSWGTAFFKNYVYISNKCEKIIVLVIGSDFINQYNSMNNEKKIQKKIKNAIITYHIVHENLDIDINNL